MGVRANADNTAMPFKRDVWSGRYRALCRTEHMFFGEDTIRHMRAMILATKEQDRRAH